MAFGFLQGQGVDSKTFCVISPYPRLQSEFANCLGSRPHVNFCHIKIITLLYFLLGHRLVCENMLSAGSLFFLSPLDYKSPEAGTYHSYWSSKL